MWSHGDQEIFTKNELVKAFDTGAIGSSAAVLNIEKLNWLNAHYIKSMDPKNMADRLIFEGFIPDEFKDKMKDNGVQKLLLMVQERSKFLGDVYKGIEFFLKDKIEYDTKAYEKYITPEIKPVVAELRAELEKLFSLSDLKTIENIYTALMEKHNIKLKNIAQATRVLITGTDVSPGIFEILTLMDKKKILERLTI
ncbi:MAG: hypothetical protein NTY22_01730 [Proteobacteria bacterium]|nr:hypothetical protein [Pseudomonadota bacterium]